MICKCGKVMNYIGSPQNGGYWVCRKCNNIVIVNETKERS